MSTTSTTYKNPDTFSHEYGLSLRQQPDALVAAVIVTTAAFFDLAVHTRFNGVIGMLFFFTATGGWIVSRRVKGHLTIALLVATPLFGGFLALRTSPWLIPFDVLALITLYLSAACASSNGRLANATVPRLAKRAISLLLQTCIAPAFMMKPFARISHSNFRRARPIALGLIITAPVMVILIGLLASADSAFASLIDVDLTRFNIDTLIMHSVVIVFMAWTAAAVLRAASADAPRPPQPFPYRLGATETIVAMVPIIGLYLTFVVTQVVIWLGGIDRLMRTDGLTYAEHARNGFFQLLAVGAITLGVLMCLRACVRIETTTQQRWLDICAYTIIGLTLVIVCTAVNRLMMYEDAYGLTMLRLYATVFAIWLGLVFVMFASLISLHDQRPSWFLAGITASGLVITFGLNIVNPEQFVVERNAQHARSSSIPFDISYARSLSNDAIPALVAVLPDLDDPDRAALTTHLCNIHLDQGAKRANLSDQRAKTALRPLCQPAS